jgi:outer membrane lipoprotein carrier protein
MSRGLFLFSAIALLSQAATPADQVIDSVQQHYNSARTISVNFTESYSVDGHQRPPEAGKLTLRKQGKMRWDYTEPAGKVFVSDGKTVFLYTAGYNKVEKVPLKDTEDMRAPLAFLLGHLDLRKEFRDITVNPAGTSWRLDAKAKSDRTPYGEIQMLVAPGGKVSQLKVLGRDQTTLSFAFSQEQLNPAVNDALFHFVIPPGAEVVNAVEYTGQDQ